MCRRGDKNSRDPTIRNVATRNILKMRTRTIVSPPQNFASPLPRTFNKWKALSAVHGTQEQVAAEMMKLPGDQEENSCFLQAFFNQPMQGGGDSDSESHDSESHDSESHDSESHDSASSSSECGPSCGATSQSQRGTVFPDADTAVPADPFEQFPVCQPCEAQTAKRVQAFEKDKHVEVLGDVPLVVFIDAPSALLALADPELQPQEHPELQSDLDLFYLQSALERNNLDLGGFQPSTSCSDKTGRWKMTLAPRAYQKLIKKARRAEEASLRRIEGNEEWFENGFRNFAGMYGSRVEDHLRTAASWEQLIRQHGLGFFSRKQELGYLSPPSHNFIGKEQEEYNERRCELQHGIEVVKMQARISSLSRRAKNGEGEGRPDRVISWESFPVSHERLDKIAQESAEKNGSSGGGFMGDGAGGGRKSEGESEAKAVLLAFMNELLEVRDNEGRVCFRKRHYAPLAPGSPFASRSSFASRGNGSVEDRLRQALAKKGLRKTSTEFSNAVATGTEYLQSPSAQELTDRATRRANQELKLKRLRCLLAKGHSEAESTCRAKMQADDVLGQMDEEVLLSMENSCEAIGGEVPPPCSGVLASASHGQPRAKRRRTAGAFAVQTAWQASASSLGEAALAPPVPPRARDPPSFEERCRRLQVDKGVPMEAFVDMLQLSSADLLKQLEQMEREAGLGIEWRCLRLAVDKDVPMEAFVDMLQLSSADQLKQLEQMEREAGLGTEEEEDGADEGGAPAEQKPEDPCSWSPEDEAAFQFWGRQRNTVRAGLVRGWVRQDEFPDFYAELLLIDAVPDDAQATPLSAETPAPASIRRLVLLAQKQRLEREFGAVPEGSSQKKDEALLEKIMENARELRDLSSEENNQVPKNSLQGRIVSEEKRAEKRAQLEADLASVASDNLRDGLRSKLGLVKLKNEEARLTDLVVLCTAGEREPELELEKKEINTGSLQLLLGFQQLLKNKETLALRKNDHVVLVAPRDNRYQWEDYGRHPGLGKHGAAHYVVVHRASRAFLGTDEETAEDGSVDEQAPMDLMRDFVSLRERLWDGEQVVEEMRRRGMEKKGYDNYLFDTPGDEEWPFLGDTGRVALTVSLVRWLPSQEEMRENCGKLAESRIEQRGYLKERKEILEKARAQAPTERAQVALRDIRDFMGEITLEAAPEAISSERGQDAGDALALANLSPLALLTQFAQERSLLETGNLVGFQTAVVGVRRGLLELMQEVKDREAGLQTGMDIESSLWWTDYVDHIVEKKIVAPFKQVLSVRAAALYPVHPWAGEQEGSSAVASSSGTAGAVRSEDEQSPTDPVIEDADIPAVLEKRGKRVCGAPKLQKEAASALAQLSSSGMEDHDMRGSRIGPEHDDESKMDQDEFYAKLLQREGAEAAGEASPAPASPCQRTLEDRVKEVLRRQGVPEEQINMVAQAVLSTFPREEIARLVGDESGETAPSNGESVSEMAPSTKVPELLDALLGPENADSFLKDPIFANLSTRKRAAAKTSGEFICDRETTQLVLSLYGEADGAAEEVGLRAHERGLRLRDEVRMAGELIAESEAAGVARRNQVTFFFSRILIFWEYVDDLTRSNK